MDVVLPTTYARWRDTRLGEATERLERDLVLDLAGPLTGKRVLDVGCGDGTYAIAAAKLGALVTAIDTSPEMLTAAQQHAAEQGLEIEFRIADIQHLPFNAASFDVVLAVTVLCFVDDSTRAIHEVARVLASGGHLVLGALNRWSIWAGWRRIRGWFGAPTWQGARFQSARQLGALVERAGLQRERTSGAIYYPPLPAAAVLLGPLDTVPRSITTLGAAFVALKAVRPTQGATP